MKIQRARDGSYKIISYESMTTSYRRRTKHNKYKNISIRRKADESHSLTVLIAVKHTYA